MAPTTDPFAGSRQGKKPPPVDTLDDEKLEELKIEIRNTYKMEFKNAPAAHDKSMTVSSEVKKDIIERLEAALAMSSSFQKAVLEEYVTPYIYNFSDLCIEEKWALGLFLPKFYDIFETFDTGFVFIQKVLPQAATRARQTIESLIDKHVSRKMQLSELDGIRGPVDTKIGQTDPYIATLFQLVQDEKNLNDLRARSVKTLSDLKDMLPGLNGAQELQRSYREKMTTVVGESLIDKFTATALKAAKALGNPPKLAPVDTPSVRESISKIQSLVDFAGDEAKEFTKEAGEDDSGDEAGDEDQTEEGVTARDMSSDWTEIDELPEEAFVAQEVDSYYNAHGRKPIFYPGWARPAKEIRFESTKAASSIEASQPSQESNIQSEELTTTSITGGSSVTIATKLKRTQGFISARGLSNKQVDEIDRKVHSPQDVLSGAIEYIKMVTSTTSREFNMAQYQECTEWLAKTNKRSDKAIAAERSDQWFRMFCGFQMEDNWVHVRFLIEALRVEGEDRPEHDEIVKLVDGAEKFLVVVFALIRCGADDPLPWLLVLDGVLRLLWRQLGLSSSSGEPTLLQKKLFGELALWCHGTAINGFVVRLPHTNDRFEKGQKLMSKWYKMVWTYNARCANDDCMRLLTHPSHIANKEVRELMSVGTREARVGSRSMRSFISTNRDYAYTCLFEVFRNSKPNEVLVILLFWYSHLYHNRTCKAHSGKPAISAF
ncbi:hypothetical protein MBLNU13_g02775t1 [Cladosporium sp. NU13]